MINTPTKMSSHTREGLMRDTTEAEEMVVVIQREIVMLEAAVYNATKELHIITQVIGWATESLMGGVLDEK